MPALVYVGHGGAVCCRAGKGAVCGFAAPSVNRMSSSCSRGADPRRSMNPLSKLPTSMLPNVRLPGRPPMGSSSAVPGCLPMTADCMAHGGARTAPAEPATIGRLILEAPHAERGSNACCFMVKAGYRPRNIAQPRTRSSNFVLYVMGVGATVCWTLLV